MRLVCGRHTVALETPVVMGVLNVTPDSFSDGGQHLDPTRAVARAHELIAAGAGILDIGGESTRPGAGAVDAAEELRRVLPVIEALAGEVAVPLSIDTSKPEVARQALRAGASMLNDVRALTTPGMLRVAADEGAAVCVMHMRGEPRTMQDAPHYDDVVGEVATFLEERVAACRAAGIQAERIAVDPGFGFGKRLEHNLLLLDGLGRLGVAGRPILVGLSRKSMIGALTGRGIGEREAGGVALAALAVSRGASIVRTHDVAPTLDAVRIAAALRAVAQGAGQ